LRPHSSRRRRHEEHLNHEAWAIPYGDLVTLLLAFFVTMYAISTVNNGKYRVLSAALTAAFRGAPASPQVITLSDATSSINDSMPINEVNRMFTAGLPDSMRMPLPQANGTVHQGQRSPGAADPRDLEQKARDEFQLAVTQQLDQVEADVSSALSDVVKSNAVQITRRGNTIEVKIGTDILFGSGAATLAPGAVAVLDGLASALARWPNRLRVAGHTDDRPINTVAFRSNWELSAARAASVVRLFADRGVAPDRLAVIGYGQYVPVQPNETSAGRNANRRVVVIILGRDDKGVL
jgi:chemotaxis protein MotB